MYVQIRFLLIYLPTGLLYTQLYSYHDIIVLYFAGTLVAAIVLAISLVLILGGILIFKFRPSKTTAAYERV